MSWGDQAPIEITTSARDVVNSSQYAGTDPVAATFGLLYAALVRHEHDVPPYEEWLDLVDEVQDIGTVVTDIGDPTNEAASVGVPSPSPASPAQISDPGSTGPTTDLLLRQKTS